MVGRRARAAIAAVAMVALAPQVGQTFAAGTTGCTLQPAVRDTTVNQGVGSYAKLTQGKDTLVRLYLTMPSCAASTDTIVITGGTLDIAGGGGGSVSSPTPSVGTTPPTLAPYTAVANDAPSDPLFVVPGANLVSATGAAFSAAFTPALRYKVKPTGASAFGVEQTIVVASISASFNARSNGLRVLVVPMGDNSATAPAYLNQFPPAASQAVQRGLKNLARALPVPEGVGELYAPGSIGLRYTVLPTLLDLGATGLNYPKTNGMYCLNGGNFSGIKRQLSSFLQTWNTANPAAQADRVVGTIWQDFSVGVNAGQGCDEGDASLSGAEGWFRASTETTGAVAGMELLHTLGATALGGTNSDTTYHSKNVQSDVTDPDRAFNVLLRRWLSADRSTMRLSDSSWTETLTAVEPEDWALAQCRLTPSPTGCPSGPVLGTAAAGASFAVSGTVSVTASGARHADLETWFTSQPVEQTADDPSSRYAVVQFGQNGELGRTRIPDRAAASSHDDADHSNVTTGDAVLDASVASIAGVQAFEVQYDGVTLYRRELDKAPQVTVFVDGSVPSVRDVTNSTQSDTTPALSADGRFLAWTNDAGIQVKDLGSPGEPIIRTFTQSLLDATKPAMPAWSRTTDANGGMKLAFVQNGDVLVTTFSGGAFSTPAPVYVAKSQTLPNPAALDPTWSPDDTQIAIEINGDLYRVDVNLLTGGQTVCAVTTGVSRCSPLAVDPTIAERHPDWGPRGVAYDAAGTLRTAVLNANGTVSTNDTSVVGTDPAWAGERLLFARSGLGIYSVPAGAPNAGTAQLTALDDRTPSASGAGALLAFDRRSGSDDDIYLGAIIDGNTVRLLVTDEVGAVLRADLYASCPSSVSPVIVDRDPDAGSVTPTSATFTMTYDPAPTCASPTMVARITDGWNTTTSSYNPTGSDDAPLPSIAAPRDGDVFTQWQSVPVAGTAQDDSSPLTYSWSLVAPDNTSTSLGSNPTPGDITPPAGGWTQFGAYHVRLTVRDAAGHTSNPPADVTIYIDRDRDNDGLTDGPRSFEETCTGGTDTDPKNAWGDADGDGVLNVDDPEPCRSASTVTVDFDPNTLQLTSSGSPITMYIRSTKVSIAGVDGSTIRIVKIGSVSVSIPQSAWSVSNGVGTAQFSRPAVIKVMIDNGLIGRYIPVVVEATTTNGQVHGLDASAPMTQPA